VVVLRALGLGDLLTAVPGLRALARAFGDHELVLAAPAGLAPLLGLIEADGRPAVDRLVSTSELEPLRPDLHEADVGVNLHGRGPQSHRILLAARPQRQVWFRHPSVPQSVGGPRWYGGEHEVKRWCRMLTEQGIPADPRELELTTPPDSELSDRVRGATIIHPGAAHPARRWPPERFAQVARAAAADDRRVLLTGSAAERELAEAVAAGAGLARDSVLAGRTNLLELAAIVAGAGRVVCGDTGVGHLATAFGTPSVLLFGPTPPGEWGPPAERGQHRVLWAGRTGNPHGNRPDPGLLSITAGDVVQALDGLALAA
jgi:ADP-heptose:LPS heptosyltransferase